MRILVTAATAAELLPALEVWEVLRNQTNNSLYIDAVETGIGATATAYHTTKALTAQPYDMAINIGIAGSCGDSPPIGTVVRPLSDYFGDCGIQTASGFQSLFDAHLLHTDAFPFKSGKLTPPPLSPQWEAALAPIPVANGITVQHLTAAKNVRAGVRAGLCARPNQTNIETMEGAAFFYVCLYESIPCIALRAISNRAGERDKSKWNIPLALQSLKTALAATLHSL